MFFEHMMICGFLQEKCQVDASLNSVKSTLDNNSMGKYDQLQFTCCPLDFFLEVSSDLTFPSKGVAQREVTK